MEKVSHPVNTLEYGPKEATDTLDEFQQLKMKVSQLVWEARDAVKEGQWDKAQELLMQVRKMTNAYQDSNVSRSKGESSN
jgi:hypothetical protein